MEYEEIKTQEIIARLRQTLEPHIGLATSKSVPETRAIAEEEDEELALLKTGFDIYNIPITSYRFLGGAVVRLRKFVRKLLRPVLERQVAYNFANTRVVQMLSTQVKTLQESQQKLEQELKTKWGEKNSETSEPIPVQTLTLAELQSQLEHLQAVQQQQAEILNNIVAQLSELHP